MKIGIITAMQVEIDLLLANSEVIRVDEHFGRKVYLAKYGNNELFMGVSGIGKANAASFTQLLIDKYEIETVINSGIAGSLEDGLGTMSVVVASELHYHDIPKRISKGTYPGLDVFPVDDVLRDLAAQAIPNNTKYRVGPIATGDDFIDSTDKKKLIVERTGALATDMESAAIAHIAAGAGVKCLIIRAISDAADEAANETYDNFEEVAANLSVEVLLVVLDAI